MQALNPISHRLQSVDMLRGIVILIMIIDHIRETFFLHLQVSDPMDITITPLDLYISRFIAHLCAPIFVFLTGLSAFLYGQKQRNKKDISHYLLIRGIFLICLEITIINFAWTFEFPPQKIFLQVIWAIGLSMISLSALIWLPRSLLLAVSIVIIAGHNLLDNIHFSDISTLHIPWAILHEKLWIHLNNDLSFRTTYPVLPWIGVISIGYYCGAWFTKDISISKRHTLLLFSGFSLLSLFTFSRILNIYGDRPWVHHSYIHKTLMSFFNLTKYPPSFLFLLFTLGIGLLLLFILEKYQHYPLLKYMSIFGSVPLFFYIIHLFTLKFTYLIALHFFGKNKGDYFGFDHVWQLWIFWIGLIIILYPCVYLFSCYKSKNKHITWLKYL